MVSKDRLDEIMRAKEKVVEGELTLWNERLSALVNAGDLRGALEQLGSPIERLADVANNCGCNVQCGAASPGQLGLEQGQPPARR